MNISQTVGKSLQWLKRSSPTILSIAAAVGVVGTVVVTSKAAVKADLYIRTDSEANHGDELAYTKLEAVKSAWKVYIPVVAVSGATIACILCSNSLSRKQQAALTAAYLALEKAFVEHKDKVKELFGEEGYERVRAEIAKDHYDFDNTLDDNLELFYFEPACSSGVFDAYHAFSDGYFQSTKAAVQSAFYHANRNFVLRGYEPLNELLDFLNIENVKYGDEVGWSIDNGVEDGYEWLDYGLTPTTIDEGLVCYIIHMPNEPRLLWDAN